MLGKKGEKKGVGGVLTLKQSVYETTMKAYLRWSVWPKSRDVKGTGSESRDLPVVRLSLPAWLTLTLFQQSMPSFNKQKKLNCGAQKGDMIM